MAVLCGIMEYIRLSRQDYIRDLKSLVPPCHDTVEQSVYDTLLYNLCKDLDLPCEFPIDAIRGKLKSCDFAVIGNTKSGKSHVDLTKRKSNRITFGSDKTKKYGPLLLSSVVRIFGEQLRNLEEITVDTSHCDVILYENGGFFDFHRDGDDANENWFSIIICLDSHISDPESTDGNTDTFSFPQHCKWLLKKDPTTLSDYCGKGMVRHSFPQSRMRKNMLILPFSDLHSSVKLNNDGDYKMIFKIDAVVKFTKIPFFIGLECRCQLCSPWLYTPINEASPYFNLLSTGITIDILYIILSFAIEPRHTKCICEMSSIYKYKELDCRCGGYCECTCCRCICPTCIKYCRRPFDCDHMGCSMYKESDDDICNGYEDGWI